jgi:hypothetical protein
VGFGTMMVLSGVELFSEKTVEALFKYFDNDFISNNTFLSNGSQAYKIDVKSHIICNCPFNNTKKPERFWHIITKKEDIKSKSNNPCPPPENKRTYDAARAKRIHWIKPLIENWLCNPDIVHFYEKISGKETLHLWHKKLDFLVIVRRESKSSDRFLVSTYLVHRNQRQRYRKRWERYEKNKPLGFEWF